MDNNDEIDDTTLKNSEAFQRFAKTGDPEALADVITEITGAEVEKIEAPRPSSASRETIRARRALGALRFIMIPELSDEMKELAYQQVLLIVNKMAVLEADGIYVTNDNQVLYNTHSINSCVGRPCAIHNPSNHHMVDWPMRMRTDIFVHGLMERFCEHGIGHPDPDSAKYLNENGPEGSRGTWDIHGCDGCCTKPESILISKEAE